MGSGGRIAFVVVIIVRRRKKQKSYAEKGGDQSEAKSSLDRDDGVVDTATEGAVNTDNDLRPQTENEELTKESSQ